MNKPAFPTPFTPGKDVCDNTLAQQGMTLREWYAGLAMQGLISNSVWLENALRQLEGNNKQLMRTIKTISFEMADQMISE